MKSASLLLILAAVTLSSCSPPALQETATPSTTPTPSSTPTRTLTPTPDRTATRQATIDAIATEDMGFLLEEVLPELEPLGYGLEDGYLGYKMRSPTSVTAYLPGYRYYDFLLPIQNPSFRNFILSVDVEWRSETGVAGCDILIRGDGDFGDGAFVEFSTLRLSGLPYWEFNTYKFNDSLRLNNGYSDAINQQDRAVNHYVLVANGIEVTAYANGFRLGTATMKQDMVQGELAFQTWQESGQSTCTFSNAWVWALSETED